MHQIRWIAWCGLGVLAKPNRVGLVFDAGLDRQVVWSL